MRIAMLGVALMLTAGITVSDAVASADLVSLSAEQKAQIMKFRPASQIISSCPDAAAPDPQNRLIGLLLPEKGFWARNLEPAALLKKTQGWAVRSVNSDIAKDPWGADPIPWNFSVQKDAVRADIKCRPDIRNDPDLTDQKGHLIGKPPFFKMNPADLASLVCFGTSDAYNSWACVVYSSKEGRYRLWYRQEMAD